MQQNTFLTPCTSVSTTAVFAATVFNISGVSTPSAADVEVEVEVAATPTLDLVREPELTAIELEVEVVLKGRMRPQPSLLFCPPGALSFSDVLLLSWLVDADAETETETGT